MSTKDGVFIKSLVPHPDHLPNTTLVRAGEVWDYAGSKLTDRFDLTAFSAHGPRTAIQKASAETYRLVYNWQYINCLRLWAQVLCAHARSHTCQLRQLLDPLPQV